MHRRTKETKMRANGYAYTEAFCCTLAAATARCATKTWRQGSQVKEIHTQEPAMLDQQKLGRYISTRVNNTTGFVTTCSPSIHPPLSWCSSAPGVQERVRKEIIEHAVPGVPVTPLDSYTSYELVVTTTTSSAEAADHVDYVHNVVVTYLSANNMQDDRLSRLRTQPPQRCRPGISAGSHCPPCNRTATGTESTNNSTEKTLPTGGSVSLSRNPWCPHFFCVGRSPSFLRADLCIVPRPSLSAVWVSVVLLGETTSFWLWSWHLFFLDKAYVR